MEESWAQEIERGASARREMLRSAGPALSVQEAARLLGATSAAVSVLILRKGILAVPMEDGGWIIPARQFRPGDHRVVSGLPDVLVAFGDVDGWTILSILLGPNPLSGTGVALDDLDNADVALAMVELARTYGSQGAT